MVLQIPTVCANFLPQFAVTFLHHSPRFALVDGDAEKKKVATASLARPQSISLGIPAFCSSSGITVKVFELCSVPL